MNLQTLLKRIVECCGVPDWWPSSDPFEIAIQAILTQNTNWKNVMKATMNLRKLGLMSPEGLQNVDISTIEDAIRPSGFYKIKAKRIKSFVNFIFEKLNGKIENLKKYSIEDARELLLSISGIGKETADTILLFALDFPIMIVDSYTIRVLKRVGFETPNDYDKLRRILENNAPKKDPETFKLLHSGFDELAKRFCKKSKPLCEECPIRDVCKRKLDTI
ncbi:MAG: endonuclease [Thermoplasmata archaeon]|nr:endonuclease [Euryarchaeota archaeon]RLF65222.1 MAG: endonuclease [Thermoplasmata archaeon]